MKIVKPLITILMFCLLVSNSIFAKTLTYSPQQIANFDSQLKRAMELVESTQSSPKSVADKLQLQTNVPVEVIQAWITRQKIKALNPEALTDQSIDYLKRISGQTNTIKTWISDSGHKIIVDAYMNQQRAKAILFQYQLTQHKKIARDLFKNKSWHQLATTMDPLLQKAVLLSMEKINDNLKQDYANYILSHSDNSRYQLNSLWIISRTVPQTEIITKVLQHADPQLSVQIMQQNFNLKYFDFQTQKNILLEAVNNPNLASAAILQLGAFSFQDHKIENFLLDNLSSKTLGGSASQALLQHPSTSLMQKLKNINSNSSGLAQLRVQKIISTLQEVQ